MAVHQGPNGRLELDIVGMTCASCAGRVEKKLNQVEGAAATVNLATERATVVFDGEAPADEALISAVESAGYKASVVRPPQAGAEPAAPGPYGGHQHDEAPAGDLLRRAVFASVLGVPLLLVSMVRGLQFEYWQWLALQLATPIVWWAAWPFHRATLINLRHRATTMDTLVSLGVIAAWSWSVWALFRLGAGEPGMKMDFDFVPDTLADPHHIYLEVAGVVVVFLLWGRYLEARAKRRSGAAIQALLDMGAKEASLLDAEGNERMVSVDLLQPGDRFVVRPGEKVATDGVVEQGESAIDNSMLTGESLPVSVGAGDDVTGAAVNTTGRLVVRATKVGADTALAHITRMVTEAQAGKAQVQRLADRVSSVFVPLVLAIAAATFVYWIAMGETRVFAFTVAVAVLVVACPCALGLATPTALLVGTGRGAQLGILIKGPEVLESTRRIDTVVLDKTGTVTTGEMSVLEVHLADGVSRSEALRMAAAVESGSEHPIARAIVAEARRGLARPADVEDFRNHEGEGVTGTVDGIAVAAGKPSFLEDHGFAGAAAPDTHGGSVVGVGWNGAVRSWFVVGDAVKPTSAAAVAELRSLGLEPVLLTGDNEPAARAVAAEVGIDRVIADVLPAGKLAVVERLKSEGRVVAMVGDGVNDAPALAAADLGISLGTGTDVAIEASDITLMSGDLRTAATAVRLSRRTLAVIKGNLFWAFAYNVAAIPLAATGYLNPLVAGAAMAFSSVFVVGNSLRLRRFSA